MSRWDRIGSHVIHSRTAPGPANGSGPVLVLVHGLVISSLYMVPTAERLAPNFRLLAPDLPGFGLSSKPDRTFSIPDLADVLAQWLRALGLDRVVLIGNSLGCQIIADFATRHAGSIQAAVLAGPTMDSRARTAPQQIGRWLVDWLQERPSLAAAHLRDYREAGLRRAWQTFRYALADPVERKLASLTAPTLVLRGSRDPIVPRRWAQQVAAGIPGARYREIPGGPHVVNYTSAPAFDAMIREFLDDIGLSGAAGLAE